MLIEALKEFSYTTIFTQANNQSTHLSDDQPSPISSNAGAYANLFSSGVETRVNEMADLFKQKLLLNGVTVHSDTLSLLSQSELCDVKVKKVERGGSIVTYAVRIGVYEVIITMLNIDKKAWLGDRKVLSTGTFGSIIEIAGVKGHYVAKRIDFSDKTHVLKFISDGMDWKVEGSFETIRQLLFQYAIAKICGAIEIGPRVTPQDNFDMVCYNNAIQYYMEKCESVATRCHDVNAFERRMLYCLRSLHSLKLAHKDVKLDNILFSPSVGDFVLADFGVSTYVIEDIGWCTETFREGSKKYMSPEMRKIPLGGTGFVDLFWNDAFGLMVTIKDLRSEHKTERCDESKQPVLQVEQDLFIAALYLRWKGEDSTGIKFSSSSPSMDVFDPYFSDIIHGSKELSHRPSPYSHPEFLIRSIGLNPELLYHLSKVSSRDQRVNILIKNYLSRICVPNELNLSPFFTNQAQREYYFSRAEHFLLKAQEEPDKDEPENAEARFLSLLRITNYYQFHHNWKQVSRSLSRARDILLSADKNDVRACYANWLVERYESPNELPASTEELFRDNRLEWQEKLLICQVSTLKYFSGYKILLAITNVLLGHHQQPELPDSTAREHFVMNLKRLLDGSSIRSARWLMLSSVYLKEMLLLEKFSYLKDYCSRLLSENDEQGYVQLFLNIVLVYASQQTGDYALAIRCSFKLLHLCGKLCVPVDQSTLFCRIWLNIAWLYDASQDPPNTVAACLEVLRILKNEKNHNGIQAAKARQRMFANLTSVGNLEQAKQVMRVLIIGLLAINQQLSGLVEVLERQTILFINSRGVQYDIPQLRQLVAFVADTIEDGSQLFDKKIYCFTGIAVALFFQEQKEQSLKLIEATLVAILRHFQQQKVRSLAHSPLLDVNKILSEPMRLFWEREGQSCQRFSSQDKKLLCKYYFLIMHYFVFALDFLSVSRLAVAVRCYDDCQLFDRSQQTQTELQSIVNLSRDQREFQALLDLMTTHSKILTADSNFSRGYALYNLGLYEESLKVLEPLLNVNCSRLKDTDKVLGLMALSDNLIFLEDSSETRDKARHYLNRAKECLEKTTRPSTILQHQIALGVCELKLENYQDAAKWLGKSTMHKPMNRGERLLVEEGKLKYGICMNKQKKHKRAVPFLVQSLENQNVEGLFYLSHSLFVLRQWRLFKKSVAALVAHDTLQQYTKYFQDYLRIQSHQSYFVIFHEAVTPDQQCLSTFLEQESVNTKEKPPAGLQMKNVLKFLRIGKQMAKFMLQVRKKSATVEAAFSARFKLLRIRLLIRQLMI